MQRRTIYLCVWSCAILLMGQVAWAKTFGIHPNFSAAQLKSKIDHGEELFLLCPLSDIVFNEKHIPGSVNIPSKQIMKTKQLPADKSTLIVTYCLGPKWVLYEKAASLVANRGYTNVATFSGGIPAWKKAGYALDTTRALPEVEVNFIDTDTFRERFNRNCIVDIRIPSLYGLGLYSKYMRKEVEQTSLAYRKKYHLKVPLSKLSKAYDRIPKDRGIIIVDHNGKQAKLAAKYLADKGYSDICCLKGGLMALQKQ